MKIWGAKWRRGFSGRRGVLNRLTQWSTVHRERGRSLLWMHASSVGEGLQARAVLECVRQMRPDVQIAYTHFSPSAESFAQSLVQAGTVDVADYLPFDTPGAARAVLDALSPTALIFAKLDVWPILTSHAARRGVKLGMISATMAEGSSRRGIFAAAVLRQAYGHLQMVGAIAKDDATRLADIGVPAAAITVTGDTRYDQVWKRAEDALERARRLFPVANKHTLTLVAGSTWPPDERILLEAIDTLRARNIALQVILAPHEPVESHLRPLERWAAEHGMSCTRLSAWENRARAGQEPAPTVRPTDLVLVDRLGVLADLYAVADIAYVGGGFHKAGLHSVLEPAVCGVPVIMGPRIDASRDAGLLLEARAGYVARTAAEFATQCLTWGSSVDARHAAGARARDVVRQGLGAAARSASLVTALV